jgi:hypothetical protein
MLLFYPEHKAPPKLVVKLTLHQPLNTNCAVGYFVRLKVLLRPALRDTSSKGGQNSAQINIPLWRGWIHAMREDGRGQWGRKTRGKGKAR